MINAVRNIDIEWDTVKCPHCEKVIEYDEESDIEEVVRDLETSENLTFKIDCPKCKKPISLRLYIEVKKEVCSHAKIHLTEQDKKYIQYRKEKNMPVEQKFLDALK